MAHEIETVLGLMVAVAVVAVLARRLQVPYPILLVIGGLGLALIPGLPRVRLNPELVFLFFLPPLLYPAALFTSWRDSGRTWDRSRCWPWALCCSPPW